MSTTTVTDAERAQKERELKELKEQFIRNKSSIDRYTRDNEKLNKQIATLEAEGIQADVSEYASRTA